MGTNAIVKGKIENGPGELDLILALFRSKENEIVFQQIGEGEEIKPGGFRDGINVGNPRKFCISVNSCERKGESIFWLKGDILTINSDVGGLLPTSRDCEFQGHYNVKIRKGLIVVATTGDLPKDFMDML